MFLFRFIKMPRRTKYCKRELKTQIVCAYFQEVAHTQHRPTTEHRTNLLTHETCAYNIVKDWRVWPRKWNEKWTRRKRRRRRRNNMWKCKKCTKRVYIVPNRACLGDCGNWWVSDPSGASGMCRLLFLPIRMTNYIYYHCANEFMLIEMVD